MTGVFITFEGGEGSGKSTQISLLAEAFAKAGIPCIKTREPGGVESAERIRELVVSGKVDAWDPLAETLLFYAARIEHLARLVTPALAEGKVVLCDRFSDSTLVYQGIGKGLSEEYIRMLHRMLLGNFKPDLTLVFDIDPQIGLKRAAGRRGTETRFEGMDMEFHRKIRAGFASLVECEPQRCALIDASRDVTHVTAKIIAAVNAHLGYTLKP